MLKSEYRIIGVMSGTSLDGIDICYVNFSFDKIWNYKIITTETILYSSYWLEVLKNCISLREFSLKKLDDDYTSYINTILHKFIKTHKIDVVDAIASHGHTVFHKPEEGITYQIGNLPQLSTGFRCPIICDFRVQDVDLGGQGAPLVPIGDQLLFYNYDICLNLGGFANMSFKQDNRRIAYDICPVNIVLNYYVRQLGFQFDDRGHIAKSGDIQDSLLKELNGLEFYKIKHPKSLGLEWVIDYVFPLINKYNLEINDVLRTMIEHSAIQIGKVLNAIESETVLITGGGVYNEFLITQISKHVHGKLVIPDSKLIDFKEALIFAFLGVLRLRNEVNCLSSVTGAKNDHSSGVIY